MCIQNKREKVMYIYSIRSLENNKIITHKKFECIDDALNYRAELDHPENYSIFRSLKFSNIQWINWKFIQENA